MGESTTKKRDELMCSFSFFNDISDNFGKNSTAENMDSQMWPSYYKLGKFAKNPTSPRTKAVKQYCSISLAFSHLRFKFYRWSDSLPGSCASLLFHFVISSVKLGSVGSFSFFAVRTEIARLVILTNLGLWSKWQSWCRSRFGKTINLTPLIGLRLSLLWSF